jgi:putative transposase
MEQLLTLVCKLNPTPKQAEKIELVLKAFADGCNYANQKVKPQINSKTTIQNMVYNERSSRLFWVERKFSCSCLCQSRS